jgi:hypothetical protein
MKNLFDIYLEDFFAFKKSNPLLFLKYCKKFDRKTIVKAFDGLVKYVEEGMHSYLKNNDGTIEFLVGVPYNEYAMKPKKLYRYIGFVGDEKKELMAYYKDMLSKNKTFTYQSLRHFSSWTISIGFAEKFARGTFYSAGAILSFDLTSNIRAINIKLFLSYIREIIRKYEIESDKLEFDFGDGTSDIHNKYNKEYENEIIYNMAMSYGCSECQDVIRIILNDIKPKFYEMELFNEEEFLIIADKIHNVRVEKIIRVAV